MQYSTRDRNDRSQTQITRPRVLPHLVTAAALLLSANALAQSGGPAAKCDDTVRAAIERGAPAGTSSVIIQFTAPRRPTGCLPSRPRCPHRPRASADQRRQRAHPDALPSPRRRSAFCKPHLRQRRRPQDRRVHRRLQRRCHRLAAVQAHRRGRDIAVVDSGIDTRHADLTNCHGRLPRPRQRQISLAMARRTTPAATAPTSPKSWQATAPARRETGSPTPSLASRPNPSLVSVRVLDFEPAPAASAM